MNDVPGGSAPATNAMPLRRRRHFLVFSAVTAVVVAGLILRWAGENGGDATWGDVFGIAAAGSAGFALLGSMIRPLRSLMLGLAVGTVGGSFLAGSVVWIAILRLGDV